MATKLWRPQHEEVPSFFSVEKSEQRDDKFSFWSSLTSGKKIEVPCSGGTVDSFVVSLSERSLEMCTENLGSETGSEDYSSDGDGDLSEGKDPMDSYFVAMSETKKSEPRSFPPPISSLGSSLMMQTRRDNGRLVVEAVSVTNKHNFVAERENGRLVLSLVNGSVEDEGDCEGEGEQFEMEIDGVARRGYDDMEEDNEKMFTFYTMSEAHASPQKVAPNKPIILPDKNSMWWGTKIEDGGITTPVTRSLPPMEMAELLSVYGSYWNEKAYVSAACKSVDDRINGFPNGEDLPNDYIAAMRVGCKEPNRSLSPWKPHCIATT